MDKMFRNIFLGEGSFQNEAIHLEKNTTICSAMCSLIRKQKSGNGTLVGGFNPSEKKDST